MSLESSIAALTQQAGLLMDLPQQVHAAAQAKITAMGAAYQGHLASLVVTVYVDQAGGLDTNSGAIGSPFKTIDKALAITPRGGFCTVMLLGAYHVATTIVVDGRRLVVSSANTVRHNVTFERVTDAFGTATTYRLMRNFSLRHGATVHFTGLTLRMPVLDGTWGTYPALAAQCGFATLGSSVDQPGNTAMISYCDIVNPGPIFAPMLGGTGYPTSFAAIAVVSADVLHGKWFDGVTAAGGTASTTLPWLLTNLVNV